MPTPGPVAGNHGNLYISILALVLRALWSTHAKVSGTEEEKGENGYRNGDGNSKGGPVGAEQVRERRKGRRARAGGAAGAGAKKGSRWSGMCKHIGQPTSGTVPIRFGTYTIRNGHNGGLGSALRGVSQANMDLGIFQETKLTDGIYTRRLAGYSVVATDAPSQHRGGVAIFHRPAPHFAVEAVQQFGLNVIGFQLATGVRRWYIVGCYLAPDDTSTIERVVEALRERPKGAELLVTGDLNINFAEPEGDQREEDIAVTLTT